MLAGLIRVYREYLIIQIKGLTCNRDRFKDLI